MATPNPAADWAAAKLITAKLVTDLGWAVRADTLVDNIRESLVVEREALDRAATAQIRHDDLVAECDQIDAKRRDMMVEREALMAAIAAEVKVAKDKADAEYAQHYADINAKAIELNGNMSELEAQAEAEKAEIRAEIQALEAQRDALQTAVEALRAAVAQVGA